ncbi:hypothetical protein KHC23_04740 [Ancylobacter dichloromethanicus]|nr:hypothetical protein [Ancylobacter dichloromethanicus]MBS7552957.1 hypothetical protein [Ancylobacter dichloromethanicus]
MNGRIGITAAKRGKPIAALATARKLAEIIRYMPTKGEDYIWVRPALRARKFAVSKFKAGLPHEHASVVRPTIKISRKNGFAERARVAKAENAYADFTAQWRTRPHAKSRSEKKMPECRRVSTDRFDATRQRAWSGPQDLQW